MSLLLEKHGVELDPEVISEFREMVNSNSNFVMNYYIERNGKNHWNAICSCMDWITVSVRYINNYPEMSEDMDVKAMQIYSLISSIDIICEALSQLHRVIVDPKLEEWPFKSKNDVFKNKVAHFESHDDDRYFGEIRSIFGAHPTALRNGKDERLFASWPHDHSHRGEDFTLNLYSNIPGKDDINFGIYLTELLSYAKERYEYLFDLEDRLNELYREYCFSLKNERIPLASSIKDELIVLNEESKRRFNNDYYSYIIEELIILFNSNTKEPHLKEEEQEFKDDLIPLILEIRNNLQVMNLVDLASDKALVSSLPNYQLNYEIPKYFSALGSDRYDHLKPMYVKHLNEYSHGRYSFNLYEDDGISLLKLRMMLYAASK